MAVSAVVIARLTSHLAPKAPTIHLKRGFAFLLFTIAAFTLLTEI
jgi:hypothetical protein